MVQESFHTAAARYLYRTQKNKESRNSVQALGLVAGASAVACMAFPLVLETTLSNPMGHVDFLGLPLNNAEVVGALGSSFSIMFGIAGLRALHISHMLRIDQEKRDEEFRQKLEEHVGYYPRLSKIPPSLSLL